MIRLDNPESWRKILALEPNMEPVDAIEVPNYGEITEYEMFYQNNALTEELRHFADVYPEGISRDTKESLVKLYGKWPRLAILYSLLEKDGDIYIVYTMSRCNKDDQFCRAEARKICLEKMIKQEDQVIIHVDDYPELLDTLVYSPVRTKYFPKSFHRSSFLDDLYITLEERERLEKALVCDIESFERDLAERTITQ